MAKEEPSKARKTAAVIVGVALGGVAVVGSFAGAAHDAGQLARKVSESGALDKFGGVSATFTGREAHLSGPVTDKDAAIAAVESQYGVRWARFGDDRAAGQPAAGEPGLSADVTPSQTLTGQAGVAAAGTESPAAGVTPGLTATATVTPVPTEKLAPAPSPSATGAPALAPSATKAPSPSATKAPAAKAPAATMPDDVAKAINGIAVHFPDGSSGIPAGDRKKLDGAIAQLKKYPSAKLELDGYVSLPNSPATRIPLSKERADTVRDYLVGGGIGAGRLTSAGKGAANPVASNSTAAGRLANQRVQLVVTER